MIHWSISESKINKNKSSLNPLLLTNPFNITNKTIAYIHPLNVMILKEKKNINTH
jgi:hypothetical protein